MESIQFWQVVFLWLPVILGLVVALILGLFLLFLCLITIYSSRMVEKSVGNGKGSMEYAWIKKV
jgi:hypothetical protein